MNCFTCERNLSAYVDDQLSHDERLELEAHLSECESCRTEYESHQTSWEAATSLPDGAAPEDLWTGIEQELRQDPPGLSLEDVALMIKGLASEVQILRQEVDEMRRELFRSEWPIGEDEVREYGGIRVRSNPFATGTTGTPRESSIEQLRRSS